MLGAYWPLPSSTRRQADTDQPLPLLQLSTFLTTPLDKAGGLLALTDVYCIFNRARGTELVSPDDLLAAGKLFPQLGASMQLKRFTSGVLVVQSNSHNTEQASLGTCGMHG